MKSKRTKAKTQCSLKNSEANLVAEWAYRNLDQNKNEPFPYVLQVQGSPHGRIARLIQNDEPTKPFAVAAIREHVTGLHRLTAVVVRQAEAICALDNPTDADELAKSLGQVTKHANDLLVQLATAGNQKAVERLAGCSLSTAISLLKLTRSNLALVKPVARQWAMWPVAYSPHGDSKKEMEAMIKLLEVGHAAPENVQGKWSNKNTDGQPFKKVLGTYAARMMQNVLRELHETPILRNRLFAEVRREFSLLGNPPPLAMTEEEKTQLVAQGWRDWIVELVNLPPFSNETARDWFEVGWLALKEMAGGNVATIKELRTVGESRAKVWRDYDATLGQQENQRERQIHDRLLEAFQARFKLTE